MIENDDGDDYMSSDDEDFSYPSDIWKSFPQKKIKSTTLKSLHNIALGNICKNMGYWMEYLPTDPHKFLYVISPFDVLSSKNTMAILSMLTEMHKFKPCYLNLIFHQHLQEMDFDILPNGWNYMKSMFNRCKRIKRLKVTNPKISKELIKRIPTSYPGIEELNLGVPHQDLIDNLKNCCKLKSLHFTASSLSVLKITFPPEIQSLTMKHLTGDAKDSDHLWSILKELKSLSRLSLHGSDLHFSTLPDDIKFPNVKALDLSNCTGLTSQNLISILEAVINIADLNLNGLSCDDTKIFNSIEKLPNLLILKIAYLFVVFDNNVKFCLKTIGSKLVTLDISGNLAIDIDLIRMHCPNLESLLLSQCTFLNPDFFEQRIIEDQLSQYSCTKLKKFELDSVSLDIITDNTSNIEPIIGDGEFNSRIFDTLCQTVYKHFMSKSLIKSLKIGHGAFVDYILKHFEGNLLEYIDFSGCRGLKKEHIVKCLLKFPNLKQIDYFGCKILQSERSYLNGLIFRAGIDVKCEGDFKCS